MPGGEKDIGLCCMGAQLLWYGTYHRCSSFCIGVEGDGLSRGANGRRREPLKPVVQW